MIGLSSRAAKQRGFTIVEFMVALLLGTILIGGAISIYLASSRSSQETERSIELLNNGRFAMQILNDTLRHAGSSTGANFGDPNNSLNRNLPTPDAVSGDCATPIEARAYDLRTYVLAEVAAADGTAFGGCVTDAVAGTDVLIAKHLVPAPIFDADPNDPTPSLNGVLDFPMEPDLDRTYAVTTATQGEVFDGADRALIAGSDMAGGIAWPYSFQVFYVRAGDDGQPVALARKLLRKVGGSMTLAQEDLVTGVEDMRIRFRYRDDSGAVNLGYASDLDVGDGDWRRVSSAEVFLLLRSDEDPEYLDDKTYRLGDRTVTPLSTPAENPPNRWRLLANRYITLRNPNLEMIRGGT
tara:strand:+ start:3442 stop:4500 length:1059 start_codon:yes stop_codon:yes gene_type:complete